MTYLLDVNVLIALLDPAHVHHKPAQAWFTSLNEAWATCPLTENGVIRVLSGSGYRNSLLPSDVVPLMEQYQRFGRHEFWPDDLSLLDLFRFHRAQLQRSKQVTDIYLLGLAAAHGGKLATFDSKIATAAVRNGPEALTLIPT